MKMKSIKVPRMVESSLKARLMGLDEDEKHLIETLPPKDETEHTEDQPSKKEVMADHFADGGMVDEEEDLEDHASVAAAIMSRRRKMAEGGMVDIEDNNDEEANDFDKLNEEALLKENYDLPDQPEDSNEHSDDIDSDKHDMISAIRRKMKKSPIVR